MNPLKPLIACLPLALSSCAVTRPVGSGLQKAAEVTAEAGLWPAEKLADSGWPWPVRAPFAVVAVVPAVGGVVVAVPLWATGTALGGQWDY